MYTKLAATALSAAAFTVAFASPASGHDLGIPGVAYPYGCAETQGWSAFPFFFAPDKDRNGDGWVCVKGFLTPQMHIKDTHVH